MTSDYFTSQPARRNCTRAVGQRGSCVWLGLSCVRSVVTDSRGVGRSAALPSPKKTIRFVRRKSFEGYTRTLSAYHIQNGLNFDFTRYLQIDYFQRNNSFAKNIRKFIVRIVYETRELLSLPKIFHRSGILLLFFVFAEVMRSTPTRRQSP